MTIGGIGKAVPAQFYIMQLAGLVIAGRRRVDDPSQQEIEASKEAAYHELCRMTGHDFGYDVERWYAFLIVGDYDLTHPYGYSTTRRFLKKAGFQAPFKKQVLANLAARQSASAETEE